MFLYKCDNDLGGYYISIFQHKFYSLVWNLSIFFFLVLDLIFFNKNQRFKVVLIGLTLIDTARNVKIINFS
jgi:hypothetical protein